MSGDNRKRCPEAGFTLVEVMVAVVILGMVMLATATALRTFGMTYERLLGATDQSSEMREVTRFLNLALRDTLPDTNVVDGSGTELMWVAPLDRVGSAGGLQHLRLRKRGDALELSFAPYIRGESTEGEPNWGLMVDNFVLVDDVDRLSFQYFLDPWSDPVTSYRAGDSSPTIPYAIGLELVVAGKAWPPLIVALDGYPLY
jgi:general secretion pathway protein J